MSLCNNQERVYAVKYSLLILHAFIIMIFIADSWSISQTQPNNTRAQTSDNNVSSSQSSSIGWLLIVIRSSSPSLSDSSGVSEHACQQRNRSCHVLHSREVQKDSAITLMATSSFWALLIGLHEGVCSWLEIKLEQESDGWTLPIPRVWGWFEVLENETGEFRLGMHWPFEISVLLDCKML